MSPQEPTAGEIQKRNFRNVQLDAIGVSISNVPAPFLPVLLTRLGATNFQVGLLTTMPGITGLLLALVSLGTTAPILLSSTLGALLYGAIGGLIISGIMPGDDDRLMINFDRNKPLE